jgi:hypothetical protein
MMAKAKAPKCSVIGCERKTHHETGACHQHRHNVLGELVIPKFSLSSQVEES